MIISKRDDKPRADFEKLLGNANSTIEKSATKRPYYFLGRSATEFENDVFDALCESAKGTDFDKSISIISGHRFPDIVVRKYFGVEVKTTTQNHWKSTGNSVLESTRIEDVERIYLYFAQLSQPLRFKYRLYQECLYDIAVTHSPRYLIDMELKKGKSIFDKLGRTYDELRILDNPIKPIVAYYRSIAKRGEEPWWMDSGEGPEIILKPTVTLWSKLSVEEKLNLRNQAMARFPELFGRSSTKYQNLAAWLAARHGIVDSSLRDRFTAGGKVDLEINNHTYSNLPKIFKHLREHADEITEIVKQIPADEAKYHWKLPFEPSDQQKVEEWAKKIVTYASEILDDSNQFIIHLLGITLTENDCPHEVREEMAHYGLD